MDFELLRDSFTSLLRAVPATLILATVSLGIGFFLAIPLALFRFSPSRVLRGLSYAYSNIVRWVPLLVIIFVIYYGAGQFRPFLQSIGLWTFFREPWFCAILALVIETSAYTAEILRGGFLTIPRGQIEAARAVGMRGFVLFRRITFPIAMRQALPAYGNEVILIIKGTALASTITIIEITGAAQQIIAHTYQPIPVFAAAGLIYLLINFGAMQILRIVERRLSPDRFNTKDVGKSKYLMA